MNKWPMLLTQKITKAAEEHDDPSAIASIVGAEYEDRSDFIESLIEEILHLKYEWNPDIQMRDVTREDGPASTEGEEAEAFNAEVNRSYGSFVIVFSRAGDVRKLLFEQNGEDIRIESVSNPNRDPDATILLRESDTEAHDVCGSLSSVRFDGSLTSVRFDGSDSGPPYSPVHISKR